MEFNRYQPHEANPEQIHDIFKKRLQTIRKYRNLKQKDMATLLDIPRSTYNGYENGLREAPFYIIIRIAKVLNVSIDYLFGQTDEPRPKYDLSKEDELFYWKDRNFSFSETQAIRSVAEAFIDE